MKDQISRILVETSRCMFISGVSFSSLKFYFAACFRYKIMPKNGLKLRAQNCQKWPYVKISVDCSIYFGVPPSQVWDLDFKCLRSINHFCIVKYTLLSCLTLGGGVGWSNKMHQGGNYQMGGGYF